MKLRTRGPTPRKVKEDFEDFEDVDVEAPAPALPPSGRRQARMSVAPRRAADRTPAAARPRNGAAPKGGVQKRKAERPSAVVRPTARPRVSVTAATPSRSSRRTRPPPLDKDDDGDVVDGEDEVVDVQAPVPPSSRRRNARIPAPLRAATRAALTRVVAAAPAHETSIDDEDVDKEKRVVAATATIDDIPEEVMLGIFSYFRPPQLCWKIGRVCRRWAAWSVSPFLWRGKEYTLSPDPALGSRRTAKAELP